MHYVLDSTTKGWLGWAESNKACAERKLRDFGYNNAGVDLLMSVANSERGGGSHPLKIGQTVKTLLQYSN